MDLVRARAIPALIAAAFAFDAAAACDGLNGTYRYKPERGDATFATFAVGKDRGKLFAAPAGGAKAQSWTSTEPRSRRQLTPLATRVAVQANATGASLTFFDAKGAALATLDMGQGWKCAGDRLQRSGETLSGLGDDVREERHDETVSKAADGSLVYREVVTTLGKTGGKPRESESRFKPAA